MKYQPYEGGAGPTPEQVTCNNQVLQDLLERIGITAGVEKVFHPLCDEATPVLALKKDGKALYVGYDRWGFVAEGKDIGEGLDQASLGETLDYCLTFTAVEKVEICKRETKEDEPEEAACLR